MNKNWIIVALFVVALLMGGVLKGYLHECKTVVVKQQQAHRWTVGAASYDDEANFFTIGDFYYECYPPVDSVVVTEHIEYITGTYRNSKHLDNFFNRTNKTLGGVEIKTMIAVFDTIYYENTEYGDYQVWYCDTSFSVDKVKEVFMYSWGFDGYEESLFPTADSIVRDCKVEIKTKINTSFVEYIEK